jgi:hypothetical protein
MRDAALPNVLSFKNAEEQGKGGGHECPPHIDPTLTLPRRRDPTKLLGGQN